jgi:uncharacterized membrane protein YhaH (DUF805 family)
MIYKFIDNNGSEISVNSLSSLQALVDSETVKENTKVKAGLRGKWTTASNIEELIFIKEVIPEVEPEEVIPEVEPEEVIPEVEPEEVIPEVEPEEVIPEVEPDEDKQPWQTKKDKIIVKSIEEQPGSTFEELEDSESAEEKSEYELEEEKRDKTFDDENIKGLNFFEAIKICLKKYFIIKGRASRSEYWFLQLLFTPLAMYVGFWSDPVSAGTIDPPPLYILSTIIVLFLFIPSITSQIRRFHDKDKSGWFILINIIPLVGWLIALVMLLDKGTPGKNRFGEYPLKSKK